VLRFPVAIIARGVGATDQCPDGEACSWLGCLRWSTPAVLEDEVAKVGLIEWSVCADSCFVRKGLHEAQQRCGQASVPQNHALLRFVMAVQHLGFC
jgi:hypothetical protein